MTTRENTWTELCFVNFQTAQHANVRLFFIFIFGITKKTKRLHITAYVFCHHILFIPFVAVHMSCLFPLWQYTCPVYSLCGSTHVLFIPFVAVHMSWA